MEAPWTPPDPYKTEESIAAERERRYIEKQRSSPPLFRSRKAGADHIEANKEVDEELAKIKAEAPPGAYEAWEASLLAARQVRYAEKAAARIRDHQALNAVGREALLADPVGAPTIVIDDTPSTLLYQAILGSSHLILIYRCGPDLTAAYQSKSEGLWRLLVNVHRKGDILIAKGKNYITTTQIHMDLQIFFTKHYSRLPKASCEDFLFLCTARFGTDYYNRLLNELGYKSPPTEFDEFGSPVLNLQPVPAREYRHPVFEPFNIVCNDHCFLNTVENIYSAEAAIRKAVPTTPYIKKMQELFDLYESTLSTEDLYRKVVSSFSEYMKHFFKLVDAPSESRGQLEIPLDYNEETVKMPINVFRTTVTLKDGTASFHIYYGIYDMPDSSLDPGSYKIILNVLPTESKMGPFGLNDVYISANLYIYKMFEYAHFENQQINRQRPKNLHTSNNFSQFYSYRYKFVGDLLTAMWPLPIVKDSAKGGSRSQLQSRSHRRKSRAHRYRKTRRK